MSTSRHLTGLRRFAKAAVAVCASLGLVLAAGGCGASSGESKTIYFWNNLVGDDGPAMQRIVKEYNAQSDYKVVFQPMNGGDLTTKIYSVMQTGKNIPDIIIGDQFQTAVLQSQGLLDTMDDWQKVAPDLKESSFLPATWKGVTVNGKAYGIPLYLYQMAIYYNKDLVKKYNLQYILDDGFVTIDEIKDLKGKLQIIQGLNDPTVLPQNCYSFLKACIAVGTQPDFFVYPGEPHNMRGHQSVHLHERITQYFEDYLK